MIEITSYQDYERELPGLLSSLSPLAGLRFGLSCVDAITELVRESIDTEVPEEHQELYVRILEEIELSLLRGELLPANRAKVLETKLLNRIMGEDHDTWIDVDSQVARWVNALAYVLEYCQNSDYNYPILLSKEEVEALDYIYDAGLLVMFTLPPFRAEWERQQYATIQ
jgi:hypothetical protein